MFVAQQRCTIYDEEEITAILAYLKQLHFWQDFLECVTLVKNKVKLYPGEILPEENQYTTRKVDVEVRHVYMVNIVHLSYSTVQFVMLYLLPHGKYC